MTQKHTSFDSFDFSNPIRRGVADAGYETPRPIQAMALAEALDGRDVLGLAETGTGKTAAFALPIIDYITGDSGPGPRALIVAPTRELAAQIDTELSMLAKHTKLKTVQIFGGVSDKRQITALRRKPDVVVACPGRLLDLHGRGELKLDHIEILVLDEADHMFDMGFLPDVRRILRALPKRRQNLLFSATMPAQIRQLANDILHEPHVVELSHSTPASTIDQTLFSVDGKRKLALLLHLIASDGIDKAIVFTRTKHRARSLAKKLDKAGHRAVALQGNMSQNARDRAMNGFRAGDYDLLIATDIASRGIDVPRVSHVVNFDMPNTVEAYTHRVGRTGRSELAGQAFTFVDTDDAQMVRDIERRLAMTIDRRNVDGFRSDFPVVSSRSSNGGGGGGGNSRRGGGGGGQRRHGGGRGRGGGGQRRGGNGGARNRSRGGRRGGSR